MTDAPKNNSHRAPIEPSAISMKELDTAASEVLFREPKNLARESADDDAPATAIGGSVSGAPQSVPKIPSQPTDLSGKSAAEIADELQALPDSSFPGTKETPQSPEPVLPRGQELVVLEKKSPSAEKQKSSVVRTFQSDIADIMKSGKVSKADVVLAEERRRRKTGERAMTSEEKKTRRKNLLIGWSALVLIIAGIMAVSFALLEKQLGKTPAEQAVLTVPRLIFVSEQQAFDITGKEREELLANFKVIREMFQLRLNTVAQIYPIRTIAGVQELVPASRFLSDLTEQMPSALARSLSGDYLYGIHAFNGNTPFLILKIEFFENAFASMLRWEENFAEDIMPIFGISPVPAWMPGTPFEDFTYKNRDLRVLRDRLENIALLYTFTDRETLVITTDIDTFDEVAARLVTPQAK